MPSVRKSSFALAAAALLAVCAALQFSSIRHESQTWDEAVEMAGGYRYLKTGENRFFLEHPPLGRILAALPLLPLNPALPANEKLGHIAYGADFLYRNRVPADTMLLAARSVTIAVTLALGLALALWVKRKWGAPAALLALALYVFDPNILAQGRYTKSGLLLTLLCFLACVAWARYLEGPSRALLMVTGILVGLATATKYSAVFLLPVFAALALLHAWRGGVYPWRAWLRAHCVVTVIGALTVLAIFAPECKALVPRTRGSLAAWGPAESLRSQVDQSTFPGRAIAWTGAHLGWRRHTLLVGIAEFAAYNRRGHEAYLLGMHSQRGWWYFYPVAFAVKTPVASLALMLLTLFAARKTTLRQVPFHVWTMAVPLVFYAAICLTSQVDTGLRHLLPAYPFLFALLGAGLSSIPWRWPVFGLVCMAAIETVAAYPHFTAFFNAAAGGPAEGPRFLVDSSLDWGQDLKTLKRYLDARGIEQIRLAYFGTAEPGYYGIHSLPLETQKDANSGSVVAVSATFLHGLYVPESRYAWLRQRAPTARIGYSIYVYDLR